MTSLTLIFLSGKISPWYACEDATERIATSPRSCQSTGHSTYRSSPLVLGILALLLTPWRTVRGRESVYVWVYSFLQGAQRAISSLYPFLVLGMCFMNKEAVLEFLLLWYNSMTKSILVEKQGLFQLTVPHQFLSRKSGQEPRGRNWNKPGKSTLLTCLASRGLLILLLTAFRATRSGGAISTRPILVGFSLPKWLELVIIQHKISQHNGTQSNA